MKRLLSILFLILIFLNSIGYYGLLLLAREQLAFEIRQKIDEHAGTISGNMILKIPYSLPYASNSQDYERTSGEITYSGEVYRMVKQRVYEGTLYIVCVRDAQTTEVNQVISEYSQNFSDQAQESGASGGKALNQLAKEYIITSLYNKSVSAGWCLLCAYGDADELYHYSQAMGVFHPPQAIAPLQFT